MKTKIPITITRLNLGGNGFTAETGSLKTHKVYDLKLKAASPKCEVELCPKISIIEINKDAVLFCVDKVSVIVDISEWVDHENEEYFVVTMKYLHDQTHKWRYIFTVGNYCFNAVKPMLGVIENYLHGAVKEENQPAKKESENNNELRL